MICIGSRAHRSWRAFRPSAALLLVASPAASGHEAFRWEGSMSGIGDLPLGIFDSSARAVNSDGSVIAGIGDSVTGYQAFRYDHGRRSGRRRLR